MSGVPLSHSMTVSLMSKGMSISDGLPGLRRIDFATLRRERWRPRLMRGCRALRLLRRSFPRRIGLPQSGVEMWVCSLARVPRVGLLILMMGCGGGGWGVVMDCRSNALPLAECRLGFGCNWEGVEFPRRLETAMLVSES